MNSLTWLGHGSWLIEAEGSRILLDPFLDDNPAATVKADQMADINHILVSHGHFDHVADVQSIAQRCGSTVVAVVEVAQWFESKGLTNVVGMNFGGTLSLPFGTVQMVPAIHTSSMPDGTYGGNPAGFVVQVGHAKIYFACDTALFGDMHLIGRHGIDIAVLPIGDHYTMGPGDSIEAVKLIDAKKVLPAHYNTWPLIEQDVEAWTKEVRYHTNTEPIVLPVNGKLPF